ncbi:MAG: response regulator [Chitinophagales bacterium]|nr:response regulator [Chitinophagales bacterium]MDW8419425.1 response regulator [Chitinophagales bacterium]
MNILHGNAEKPRILLVEDNPGDIRLTQEALRESNLDIHLDVVSDGEQAVDFLNRRGKYAQAVLPNIILLDLNLPKKNGIEVLREIKSSDALKRIPVIVLTTSDADHDISKAYGLHANCYILKPVDFDDFAKVIKLVETFWFNTVKLPSN